MFDHVCVMPANDTINDKQSSSAQWFHIAAQISLSVLKSKDL